jgi:hypothetical protein
MHAPQVVVLELEWRRHLNEVTVATAGIARAEYPANRTVLAAGVARLKLTTSSAYRFVGVAWA